MKLPNLLIGIPILAYCYFIWRFAVYTPILDDHDFVLAFLAQMEKVRSFSELLTLVFQPHNEHFAILPRFIVALVGGLLPKDYLFPCLILIMNLAIFGILYLLLYFCQRSYGNNCWKIFFPVPFLLLTPTFYGSALWVTAGIQFQLAILFVVALAVALSLDPNSWKRPLICSVFGLMCFAGALPAAVICAAILATNKGLPAKLSSTAICLITLTVIFFGSRSQLPHSNATTHSPAQFILGILTLIGAPIANSSELSVAQGGITLFILSILIARQRSISTLEILSLILLAMIASISFGRSGFGAYYIFKTSRYHLTSILFLIVTYLKVAEYILNSRSYNFDRFVFSASAVSIFFWGAKFYTLTPQVIDFHRFINNLTDTHTSHFPIF